MFSKRDRSKLEENAQKAVHGFQKSMRTMVKDRSVMAYGQEWLKKSPGKFSITLKNFLFLLF